MDTRTILEQVARGELSPEEAADRLAAASESAHAEPTHAQTLNRVRVVGAFRTARIMGDPTVREATVEGEHTAERRDGVLVVNADAYEPGEVHPSQFRFSSGNRPRVTLGLGSKPFPLTIRMNPDLALDVQMAAGTLTIEGVRAPISADVSAGTIRIDGFRSPVDLSVAGGSVAAHGLLDRGSSRIRCEAGKVKVVLDAASSVRVTGRAGLGRIELPGQDSGFLLGTGAREAVIGSGEGTLDIDVSMGLVTVQPA